MKTRTFTKDIWINLITIIALLLLLINVTPAKDKTDKTIKSLKKLSSFNKTLNYSKMDTPVILKKDVATDEINIKYKFPIIDKKTPNYKLPKVF